jgi:hypothetical protein
MSAYKCGREPAQGAYNHASVIRQMQYLQGHTRIDITKAVSQCTGFTHNPKRSHELALEQIGLYLKGKKSMADVTSDKTPT